jgi:hypothetical protein
MPKPRKLAVGDVFTCIQPNGHYGAIRILRVDGRSVMVATTPYFAPKAPAANDAVLRQRLARHRFAFAGQDDVLWVRGGPPEELGFEFLGNVPLDADEAACECNAYGAWGESSGIGAYLEWRWINDRPAFEAEVEAARVRAREEQQRALRMQKPKRMLPEDKFWNLIGCLDWSRSGNDDAVLEPMVAALAAMPKADIRGFHERLAWNLYRLDTRAHARHIGGDAYVDDDSHFSADGFLYARCCAVANGQAFYEAALADPARMPKDLEFEALLSAADAAWERRTGGEFDGDTGCSFESFSNLEGWAKPR